MLLCQGHGITKSQRLDLSGVCCDELPGIKKLLPDCITLETSMMEPGLMVHADRENISRILKTLVVNAIEAIGQHRGRIGISTGHVSVDQIPMGLFIHVIGGVLMWVTVMPFWLLRIVDAEFQRKTWNHYLIPSFPQRCPAEGLNCQSYRGLYPLGMGAFALKVRSIMVPGLRSCCQGNRNDMVVGAAQMNRTFRVT